MRPLVVISLLALAVIFSGLVVFQESANSITGFALGPGIQCGDPSGCLQCNQDSDCGADEIIGDYYCQGGNVYANYIRHRCLQLTSEVSTCSQTVVPSLVEVCSDGKFCVGGQDSCEFRGGCLDINEDGSVDLSDAVIMTNLGLNNVTSDDESFLPNADFDDNLVINRVDLDCFGGPFGQGEQASCPQDSFWCESCEDNRLNQDETDIDCGGSCSDCSLGRVCSVGSDCSSNFCDSGRCRQVPSCSDGVQNGDETDTDCGGSCSSCVVGYSCSVDSDCSNSICTGGVCTAELLLPPALILDPFLDKEAGAFYIDLSSTGIDGIESFSISKVSEDGVQITSQQCGGSVRCEYAYFTNLEKDIYYEFDIVVTTVKGAVSKSRIDITDSNEVEVSSQPVAPVISEALTESACSINADCGDDLFETYCLPTSAGSLINGDVYARHTANRCVFDDFGVSSCLSQTEESLLVDCGISEHCFEGSCSVDVPVLKVSDIVLDPSDDIKEQDQVGLYARVQNLGYLEADYSISYEITHLKSNIVSSGLVSGKDINARVKEDGSSPAEDTSFVLDYVFEQPGDYEVSFTVNSELDDSWREEKELTKEVFVRKGKKVCIDRALNVLWCKKTVLE